MKQRRIRQLSESFRDSLVNDTVRFWTDHAVDREFGGFTNQLDRTGSVLCTDKPMWFQGRFTWTFARRYNTRGAGRSGSPSRGTASTSSRSTGLTPMGVSSSP